MTSALKTGALAYVSFDAAKRIASSMTETSASLESYRATLNTVLKDVERAGRIMAWSVEFANKTPFETDSVVEATVRLESYGLEAQKVLPRVGDMAAVMNKDIMQAVEAVADAQNGELERLKEFGITKKKIIEHGQKQLGYMNLVNKKGQITDQVKFNETLMSLMEESFSGGMENQAELHNGLMSTISGVWKSGLATMSGVTMTGEVIDGSLFHTLKVNAKSMANMLTGMVEDGTFERIGEHISKFVKYIGFGLDFAKMGMKEIWPYIKKTGEILESLIVYSMNRIKDFKPIFDKIGANVKWFRDIFVNSFNKSRMMIKDNIPTLLAFRDNIIDLGGKIKSVLLKAFELIKPPVQWIIENGMPLVVDGIMSVISFAGDMYDKFKDMATTVTPGLETLGDALMNGLVAGFELAKPIVEYLLDTGLPLMSEILGGVVDAGLGVYTVFSDNWSLIEPIIVGITSALLLYKGYLLAVNAVTMFTSASTTVAIMALYGLQGAIAILTSPITLVIAAIAAFIAIGYTVIKNWDEISAWLGEKFTAIGDWAAGVGERISAGFATAYDGVIQTWSGIKEWFGGLWEGIVDVGKGYVNIYVKILNWLIDGINKINFQVPDWVPEIGGKTVGVNVPNIPYLASGGVTTGPTLAMIGEGKEQEAVLPLSVLSGLFELAVLRANKMAEKIGKPKSAKEIFTSFREKSSNVKNTKSIHIEYKPQIIIEGNADKAVVKEALVEAQDEFDKKMDERERRNKRLAFG